MTCKEAAEIGRAAGFPKYSAAAHSLSSNPTETGVMRVPALQRALRGEKRSQNDMVLEYMEKHGSIDGWRAQMDLGVMRLASRINELRNAGIPILGVTHYANDGRRWKVYSLIKNAAPGGGTPKTAND